MEIGRLSGLGLSSSIGLCLILLSTAIILGNYLACFDGLFLWSSVSNFGCLSLVSGVEMTCGLFVFGVRKFRQSFEQNTSSLMGVWSTIWMSIPYKKTFYKWFFFSLLLVQKLSILEAASCHFLLLPFLLYQLISIPTNFQLLDWLTLTGLSGDFGAILLEDVCCYGGEMSSSPKYGVLKWRYYVRSTKLSFVWRIIDSMYS